MSDIEEARGDPPGLAAGTVWILWAVVVAEMVLPVPALLSFGAVFVLLVRPPWFLAMVKKLYGEAA